MMEINGRTIIITGASAGIGRATAVSLAQSGANIVIIARREARLQALAGELADSPGQVLAIAGDIQDPTFAQELIARTVGQFGRLNVLINNAGVGHLSQLAEMPLTDVQTIWNTNVNGLIAATQAAVAQMKRQGGGQIINVSSILGQRPLPGSGVYCASKTAVNFLSRSLRMELKGENIIVTLVYPGLTTTEFSAARLGQQGGSRLGIKGIPAERVARAIVQAIRYGRTEVYVSWYDWLFAHSNRLFPRLIDWGIGHTNLLG
ncbi:MAG: SDR family NAD(P)-dependent oxidoreductase [Ardenticatenaceae bacterium]|nr:SDR family NAD(P)-dependent oxidoreductase [Ardenticatenaceae bacterium]MCB9445315.1 SDR family NAD(P)-dependent oxidoreductase [Ardenticatenaceae bacterium]